MSKREWSGSYTIADLWSQVVSHFTAWGWVWSLWLALLLYAFALAGEWSETSQPPYNQGIQLQRMDGQRFECYEVEP